MKTKTSFGKCLGLLIIKHKLRQSQLAEQAKVTQATISRIISNNQAVDDSVARALCSCWPDRSDNIQLLIAGLSDVIRRWGFNPEADIEIHARDTVAAVTPTQAETDLSVIRSNMHDDVVSDLIHDLAVILRRSASYAARKPAPYGHVAETSPDRKPRA